MAAKEMTNPNGDLTPSGVPMTWVLKMDPFSLNTIYLYFLQLQIAPLCPLCISLWGNNIHELRNLCFSVWILICCQHIWLWFQYVATHTALVLIWRWHSNARLHDTTITVHSACQVFIEGNLQETLRLTSQPARPQNLKRALSSLCCYPTILCSSYKLSIWGLL